MASESPNWTGQQLAAIGARSRDVLVTASAGTGKTAVLSGRCVDIITTAGRDADVRRMLVLTFTEAAAAEMRERIGQAIRRQYLSSRDANLRRQLMFLDAADISTIHSFCKRLISEHFYRLGIDPTFRIIDEDEQRLLKRDIRDHIIRQAYEEDALAAGLNTLFAARPLQGKNSFVDMIITIHDYLDSVSSRRDWYGRADLLCEIATPDLGELGQKQRGIVQKKLETCLSQLELAARLDSCLCGSYWFAQIHAEMIAPIQSSLDFLKNGTFEQCAAGIRDFVKPKWKARTKGCGIEEHIAELVKLPAAAALDTFKNLRSLAVVNDRYCEIMGAGPSLQTKMLVELVRRFEQRYCRLKRELNCLDFADLEHKALELLSDSIEGREVPSAVALAMRRRYQHIFVDEYQDVNAVQESILERLSSGNNVFVVGDIKQSIYSWRQAQPEIFLERLSTASTDVASAINALRVDLTGNFRSRSQVLDFVNAVFSRIMTAPLGGVDYDRCARLEARADYKALEEVSAGSSPAAVELHLLTDAADDDAHGTEGESHIAKTTAAQRQAALIGRRIQQMVGSSSGKAQFQIYDRDTKTYRDVEYRDIVILMRSVAGKSNDYADILRLMGVPVSTQNTSGYFEATEIADCVSLLCVLDNPQRDIELAAVMRSPLFAFDDTALLAIRDHADTIDRACNFYFAVWHYAKSGLDKALALRLEAFLSQIETWRTLGRRGSIADLVWRILGYRDYLAFVSALPNGRQRRANLLKLHDRAIQFEGFASCAKSVSLTRFVAFIQTLLEEGGDWAQAQPDNCSENAVRIMSVHKSKGLEYPVVFVAELNNKFNKRDASGQCLIDAVDTLGLEIIDAGDKSRYPTIAHQVIAERKHAIAIAEEMRILYVALTRARERLILTGSVSENSCRDLLSRCAVLDEQTIPGWMLTSAQKPLEWILYSLGRHQSLLGEFNIDLCECPITDDLFALNVYRSSETQQLAQIIVDHKRSRQHSAQTLPDTGEVTAVAKEKFSRIKDSLCRRYPYEDLARLRAKTSVSQLTHKGDEFAQHDYEEVLAAQPHLEDVWGSRVASHGQLVGTATHLVMQRIDLSQPVTCESIEAVITSLVDSGAIEAETAVLIDRGAILRFFQSELGHILLRPDSKIYREWPFSFATPACAAAPTEIVIVQGIIDVLIETAEGLIIIDFKTDRLTAGVIAAKAAHYSPQMNLYAKAAAAIFPSRPIKKYLYFLSCGMAAKIA